MKEKLDILFIQGLEFLKSGFIGYILPLARALENNNYKFKILDINSLSRNHYSIEGVLEELDIFEIMTIGMTTNSDNIQNVYKLCEAIKKKYPTIPIILGGPQVTFSDRETLTKCKCDVIIRNYGEHSIIKVLNSLIHKINGLENIKGISYINGEIIRNSEDIVDVNSIDIPQYAVLRDMKYWVIPKNSYYDNFRTFLELVFSKYSFFVTGRGCPYRCAFCVEGNIKNKYHYRNIENVKKDLKYFISITRARRINIADDTLTCSPKRVRALCKMIKEVQNETYPFEWFAEGRADVLSKNPELIGEMHEAGLVELQIGIESGRQETLDAYNKGITLAEIEKVIQEVSKYDKLKVFGNIILGNPHESFKEYTQTVDFFKKLILLSDSKFDFNLVYLAPFVGTPIRSNPEKYGLEILIDDFEFNSISMSTPICRPHKMSLKELYQLRNYTRKSISQFLEGYIYNLSSKEIMRKQKTRILTKSSYLVYDQFFSRLPSMQRFALLATAQIVNTEDDLNKCLEAVPLRLWNVKYSDNEGYFFTALNRINIYFTDIDFELYQLASGKNTILQIHTEINKKFSVSLEDIFIFYKKLEDRMALVLRDF